MKQSVDIAEIFSLLDTALLSALLNNNKDSASTARKWLLTNKREISPGSYQFLNSLNLQKKGFNIYLKKWLKDYADRRTFILNSEGVSDEEWILKMGRAWEDKGGVFFAADEDDERILSSRTVKAAQQKGVVSLLNKVNNNKHVTFELAVCAKKQYHDIIAHFNKCAIPIIDRKMDEKGTMLLLTGSPRNCQVNQRTAKIPLPFYAEWVCGIKRSK